MTVTWWLYRGEEPIASVRLSDAATPEQVRAAAVAWHRRVPLCYPTAPFEHESYLRRAEVRR